MGLNRAQYNQVMMEYAEIRERNEQELERRRSLIYAKFPEYKQIEDEIPSIGSKALRAAMMEPEAGRNYMAELRARISELTARKAAILRENGYPEDYLTLHYDCPDCRDTGYIEGKKCHCLKKKEAAILYDQSNIKGLLIEDNFDKLTLQHRTGDDFTFLSRAVALSRSFIADFDTKCENLYFYGSVGTGKTFLSVAIAGELLKTAHSVLYFSATGLFETISSYTYGRKPREEYAAFLDDLYSADLLIIDDLGTEYVNDFVRSQLFECIENRLIGRRHTIISSNLSLSKLREQYSDRIFSRVYSNYTLVKLTGPDCRMLNKMQNKPQ